MQIATSVLPDSTRMGEVVLDVANLASMKAFYAGVVGLDILDDAATVRLGRKADPAVGKPELTILTLRENKALPMRPQGSAGLYHTAILFESPAHLAAAIYRIAREVPQLYTGSGDHHVSQAFYLDDPEGNGVELYVDRPRDQWIWDNGQVHMTTNYIDPQAFVNQHAAKDREPGVAPDVADATSLGHVHLQVGNVREARDFYVNKLGFAATAQLGNQALFVSAGGYHHHMAMNTWGTAGTGLRVPALGLGRVDVVLPSRSDIDDAVARLGSVRDDGCSIEVDDPWGNIVRLTPAS